MATALAVASLRAEGKSEFERIADKGIRWLTKELGDEETQSIIAWAAAL
jgi:hypothetical protein